MCGPLLVIATVCSTPLEVSLAPLGASPEDLGEATSNGVKMGDKTTRLKSMGLLR